MIAPVARDPSRSGPVGLPGTVTMPQRASPWCALGLAIVLPGMCAGAAEVPPLVRERIEDLRVTRGAAWVETHQMVPGTLVVLGLEPDVPEPGVGPDGTRRYPRVELYWADGLDPDAPCHHGRMLDAYIAWRETRHRHFHRQFSMALAGLPEYAGRNIDDTLKLIGRAYMLQVPRALAALLAVAGSGVGGASLAAAGLTVIAAEATAIEFMRGDAEGRLRYGEIVGALDGGTVALGELFGSNRVLLEAPSLEKGGVLLVCGKLKDAYAHLSGAKLERWAALRDALLQSGVEEQMLGHNGWASLYATAARKLPYGILMGGLLRLGADCASTKTRTAMGVVQTQILVHLCNAHALGAEARKGLEELSAGPSAALMDKIAGLTTRAYQDLEIAFFLMAVVMRYGTNDDIFGIASTFFHDLVSPSDPAGAKVGRLLESAKNWEEKWRWAAQWVSQVPAVGESVVRYGRLLDAPVPRYRVEDLGLAPANLVGGAGKLPAITRDGRVLMRVDGDGYVLWERGRPSPVPFHPTAISGGGRMCGSGEGRRISVVADERTYASNTTMAHAWNAGLGYRLPPGGFNTTFAADINDDGHVVGAGGNRDPRRPGPGSQRAVLWAGGERGSPLDLGPGEATAINGVGQVVGNTVGRVRAGPGKPQGFIWERGQARLFDGPLGAPCEPQDISDRGVVVGLFHDPGGNRRAFLWDGRGSTELAVPGAGESFAWAINGDGLVVGEAKMNDGRRRAQLWVEGRASDITALIGTQSDHWALETATAINDAGQIVGTGTADGRPRYYLASPIR